MLIAYDPAPHVVNVTVVDMTAVNVTVVDMAVANMTVANVTVTVVECNDLGLGVGVVNSLAPRPPLQVPRNFFTAMMKTPKPDPTPPNRSVAETHTNPKPPNRCVGDMVVGKALAACHQKVWPAGFTSRSQWMDTAYT